MTSKVMNMIYGAIGIVVLAIVFTAVYPMVGGATGVVATTLSNATSPGYVGATMEPLADLIPTLYVIGVIVALILLSLGLLKTVGGDSKASGYF